MLLKIEEEANTVVKEAMGNHEKDPSLTPKA